ncbi:MAG: flagellin N-terminal helical domain-containing protein [Planctomycetota bacterium]|jgi:flagellin
MGLRINTNIASISARDALADVTRKLQGSYRRLSTGLRIATAADDAAGLAISERLRAQIRSLEQARRNANDGISLVQTAEGTMHEVSGILIRLREMAIQASNGTVAGADRDTLQQEFAALRAEIDRIGHATHFNNGPLLDGSSSVISFQIGFGTNNAFNQISVSLDPILSTSLALNTLDIGSGGDTSLAIGQIDAAINTVSAVRGSLGAIQNRLGATIRNLGIQVENLSAADSRIRDVDIALETAALTRNSILQEAALSILAQANAQPTAALALLS